MRPRVSRKRRSQLIEDGVLEQGGIEALAARIGVTSRHLRRIFDAEFGVSPIEYAQTQRLLLAKRLLTDTALPVLDVALASGFGSLRRFNALIRARYRMPPSRLRKDAAPATLPSTMRFELAYRPPYDWESLLGFLRARAIDGRRARRRATATARTLAIEHRGATAASAGSPSRNRRGAHALALTVSASLARVVPAVLSRVRHAFDLALRSGADRRSAWRARGRRIRACASRARATDSSSPCVPSSASRSASPARGRCSVGWSQRVR